MPTVMIGADTYEVYADVAAADLYLQADFRLDAIWTAATADQKARALVTSTRIFERTAWEGERTAPAPGQPLAWPRTGADDAEGEPVPDNVIPDDITNGSIVQAALIVETPAIGDNQSTASNVKGVKAGSAQVDFFQPTIGKTFSDAVFDLIKAFLGSTASIAVPLASGTEAQSKTPFSTDHGQCFSREEGFS